MRNKIVLLTAFILLSLCSTLSAYDNLRILDPQSWWTSGQGSIDEASFSVRPKGLYMEYGVYLTISAKGLNFSAFTNYEIEFKFDLPEGTIVNDLWLWVGNDIMKAYILDQWTANGIYEGIVNRKRDPAILFKKGANSYELRVYPLSGNKSRKVKMTFLVPVQWAANMVSAPLPVNLIKAGKNIPEKLTIKAFNKDEWKNPRLLEMPHIEFPEQNDPVLGTYQYGQVPAASIPGSLNIAFDNPMTNGCYLNAFKKGNEGVYQLALLPSTALNLAANKKVVLLFNYETGKSNLSASDLLEQAKSSLLANLTSRDSFNLFLLSGTQVVRASAYKWLKADSATILKTFSQIASNNLTGNSNLSPLLVDGISFIKENGNNAGMLLVSNSDGLGDNNQANALIRFITAMMNPPLPLHIADFCNTNKTYYFGGRTYYGNEYLYINLARITFANYKSIRTSPSGTAATTLINDLLKDLNGFMATMDLHTTIQNGFCFGRLTPGGYKDNMYLNSPILQVGKFKGTYPFKIQLSGEYLNIPFSKEIVIEAPEQADSTLKVSWAGCNVRNLMNTTQTNSVINQVLHECLNNRILSEYTAFLALEPSDTTLACADCIDETGTTSVRPEDMASDTLLVQGFPNPFNAQVTLKVTLPQNSNIRDVTCSIYNVLGELIKTFNVAEMGQSRNLTLAWNGYSDRGEMTSSGVYFFVVNTPVGRQTLKLLMLK